MLLNPSKKCKLEFYSSLGDFIRRSFTLIRMMISCLFIRVVKSRRDRGSRQDPNKVRLEARSIVSASRAKAHQRLRSETTNATERDERLASRIGRMRRVSLISVWNRIHSLRAALLPASLFPFPPRPLFSKLTVDRQQVHSHGDTKAS